MHRSWCRHCYDVRGRGQALWEHHLSRPWPGLCDALDHADGWRWLAEGGHDDRVAGGQGDHHGRESVSNPRGQRRGLAGPGGHPGDQGNEVHVLLGVHL